MAPLNLAAGPSSIKVKVQPAVLLSICDAYVRRNSKHKRVVGTLLGYVGEGGVVEVKNCYAVPHNDHPDSVCCFLMQLLRVLAVCLTFAPIT